MSLFMATGILMALQPLPVVCRISQRQPRTPTDALARDRVRAALTPSAAPQQRAQGTFFLSANDGRSGWTTGAKILLTNGEGERVGGGDPTAR